MIEVKELFYTYPNDDQPTLKDLNFKVEKGEIFGFLGPSGAGKTTTQKILLGVLQNYQGKIVLNNHNMDQIAPTFYENIGVAFEFPNFFTKLTGMENLNFFRSLYSQKTQEPEKLLQMVGLMDDAEVRVENYSKGMKTRINFCRALINNPDILFLDEPTSGLDPANQKNIKNIIKDQKKQGRTVFLTTHNMTVADQVCDRIGFITDGEINLIDSPRNLKIQNGEKIVNIEYIQNSLIKTKSFDLNTLGENEEFLDVVRTHEVKTIHSQEATLEDVFIKTTGKELR